MFFLTILIISLFSTALETLSGNSSSSDPGCGIFVANLFDIKVLKFLSHGKQQTFDGSSVIYIVSTVEKAFPCFPWTCGFYCEKQ